MERPLYLVATDLSRPSRNALSRAGALARRTGAALRLYCAVPANLVAGDGELLARVRDGVARLGAKCVADGFPTTWEVAVVRDVAESIVAHAGECGATMIVVGPSGVSGWKKWVLGSVTERVMRLAPACLLVARGAGTEAPRHVLAALDRTEGAARALHTAIDLCERTGARLTAVHVVPPPGALLLPAGEAYVALSAQLAAERVAAARGEFERWVAEFPHDGTQVDVRVLEGSPAETVVAEVKALDPDLVVIGTHGKSAVHEFFVGSVARAVATACSVSVLLVRARPPRRARRAGSATSARKR